MKKMMMVSVILVASGLSSVGAWAQASSGTPGAPTSSPPVQNAEPGAEGKGAPAPTPSAGQGEAAPAGQPPPGTAAAAGQPPPVYMPPPIQMASQSGSPSIDGRRKHDGFYLRLQLGLGGMSSSANANGISRSGKGLGPALGVAVGGAVLPNFIVFGALIDSIASKPTLQENGADPGVKSGGQTVAVIGAGAAYYLPAYNVFFAGTLGVAALRLADSGGKTLNEGNNGIGTELLVGKEWWLSDNWGLGAAAQFTFSSIRDKQDAVGKWNTVGGGLLLTATYN